jgi:DNA-binding MarR family transcriptional regulator
MPGVFDLERQQQDLDARLVAGIERLGQALRGMLRDAARQHGLSPIQLQLLIQIGQRNDGEARVGALAERFDVTAPTVSDAVAALVDKGLVRRSPSERDGRMVRLTPTEEGMRVMRLAETWADPLLHLLEAVPRPAKLAAFDVVSLLIEGLHDAGVIGLARMCRTCRHLRSKAEGETQFWCDLLKMPLRSEDLRVDCPEHEEGVAPTPR